MTILNTVLCYFRIGGHCISNRFRIIFTTSKVFVKHTFLRNPSQMTRDNYTAQNGTMQLPHPHVNDKNARKTTVVWYEVRLSVMSETSKHLRCLLSTEVTIQQIYKDKLALLSLISFIDFYLRGLTMSNSFFFSFQR